MTAPFVSRAELPIRSPSVSRSLGGGGGRTATIIVAPSDAPAKTKAGADVVLPAYPASAISTLNALTSGSPPYSILLLEGYIYAGEGSETDRTWVIHGSSAWDNPGVQIRGLGPATQFEPGNIKIVGYNVELSHMYIRNGMSTVEFGASGCSIHDFIINGAGHVIMGGGQHRISRLWVNGGTTIDIPCGPTALYFGAGSKVVSDVTVNGTLNLTITDRQSDIMVTGITGAGATNISIGPDGISPGGIQNINVGDIVADGDLTVTMTPAAYPIAPVNFGPFTCHGSLNLTLRSANLHGARFTGNMNFTDSHDCWVHGCSSLRTGALVNIGSDCTAVAVTQNCLPGFIISDSGTGSVITENIT